MNLPNLSKQEASELLEGLREAYQFLPRAHRLAVRNELEDLSSVVFVIEVLESQRPVATSKEQA